MLKEKRFMPRQTLDFAQKKTVEKKVTQILSLQHDILFAYLFGSFIKEDSFRDIDISVYMDERTDEKYGFNTEYSLSSLLSDETGFDVEVKILNKAPVYFQATVLSEGEILFCRDDEKRIEFMDKVTRKYKEYVHFRNIYLGIDGKSKNA